MIRRSRNCGSGTRREFGNRLRRDGCRRDLRSIFRQGSFLRTAARASADKAAYRSDKNNDSAEKNIRSVHLILRSCAEFAPRGYFLREGSC